MLRFKQQSRRDHVVSLLPPISVIKNKESSVQERIYSDTPPPMTYTGSFPAKVLRHLDKSTFYSTPTIGETFLAKKTMHDEGRKTDERNEVIKTSCLKDKDDRTDHNKKNKNIKCKIKTKGTERKVNGMKREERRCSSAPGFREDELGEQLLETGNLTAPVTPRFNAPINDTRKSAGKPPKVYTPTRSPTPRFAASPDVRIVEQDAEVVLELRGDRIETASHVKDTPHSRVGTPCMFDWQTRVPEKGISTCSARPKIRSAIREVPCAQKRTEKIPPKFEIRAVGFSLPFHDKSESGATTKERKNEPLLKDTKVMMKDKTIKIPRTEVEDQSTSLSSLLTVTEAESTSRDDGGNGPKSETEADKESTLKENNNSQENEETERNENTKEDSNAIENVSNEDEQSENTEKAVKFSDKLEESLKKKPDNENEKENESVNENGNEPNEPKTENDIDLKKDGEKKKSPIDKKRGRRNSKTKGCKK